MRTLAIRPDRYTDGLLEDVYTERYRQYDKLRETGLWDCADPSTPHPTKMLVLMEEVGEVANCILEAGFDAESQGEFNRKLYKELVQVAAVAVACAESLVR